ncbi:DUF883 family protein [Horticoccus luteus]|uniref:DUF883 family protein n=1 Tax=Horticoccus luteus TaxID=2862869 RepID=A0A8F9XHQ9_9BACT|nr:DUF883 family protein [Horticoccus luteus]QYM79600.1 DUF883 family protein [Horticoccus luteus]
MEEAYGQMARDRVLADLRALAGDAEALLKATTGDAGDKAKEIRGRLAAAIERAKGTYTDLQAQGIESAKEAARKADRTIRNHPYESIAIALGVGVLLGVLLRRK